MRSAIFTFAEREKVGAAKMSDRPEDLKLELDDLMEELHEVKVKWYMIGIQLKIPRHVLEEISKRHGGDFQMALCDMLDSWLRQINPKPSWAGIVKALNSRSVGESTLAENVATRKKCTLSPTTIHSATLPGAAAARKTIASYSSGCMQQMCT